MSNNLIIFRHIEHVFSSVDISEYFFSEILFKSSLLNTVVFGVTFDDKLLKKMFIISCGISCDTLPIIIYRILLSDMVITFHYLKKLL